MQRCTNPKNTKWLDYGGATPPILIEDDRWRDFALFLSDMGERPEGTTIDRVNNARGYCKDNCRWATAEEQMANRRAPGPGHFGRGGTKTDAHRAKLSEVLKKARAARSFGPSTQRHRYAS